MSEFTREVIVRSAFDATHDDPPRRPTRDYGRHGAEIVFVLKGSGGAVSFTIYTNWMLPETWAADALRASERDVPEDLTLYRIPNGPMRTDAPGGDHAHLFCRPMPADVGYHAIRPRDDDTLRTERDCDFTSTGRCYYDGSSLLATRVFVAMLRGGSDALWKELEHFYAAWITRVSDEQPQTFGDMIQTLGAALSEPREAEPSGDADALRGTPGVDVNRLRPTLGESA